MVAAFFMLCKKAHLQERSIKQNVLILDLAYFQVDQLPQ